jgi:Protein of unknown function (DUF2971)
MTSSSGHVMASGDQTRIDRGLLRRSDGWGGNLQLGEHASRVEVALMPRQRLVEQVWGVARVRPSCEGTVEVIAQLIPVRRVRAALDDPCARLLALTTDREPAAGADPGCFFHRGWGRAPMWAHYGNQHRGVCLVLDTLALIDAVRDLPVTTGRYTSWGRINYIDKPIPLDLSGTFVDQHALDEALEALLDRRWKISGLHMTKNTDWAYETEFRFAVVDLGLDERELDTELYVPLNDCLKGFMSLLTTA